MKLNILFLALLLSFNATAFATDCSQNFYDGTAPELKNSSLSKRGHRVCYSAYALYASGLTKTAIWTSEYLTKEAVTKAKALKRKDSFFADTNLPPEDRAELSDYKRSGFDRGHMAPNGNMPDTTAQAESFSLANMIPQVGSFNSGLWSGIESTVRNEAKRHGELYVVTGPVFTPDSNGQYDAINGRVLIPSHVWKAIYNPKTKEAGAYWAPNAENSKYEEISLSELASRTGIDPFPTLPSKLKLTAADLPDPNKRQNTYRVPEAGNKAIGILKRLILN